jgi:UDP-N-acetylenolpyruvoylglucosamine reductase
MTEEEQAENETDHVHAECGVPVRDLCVREREQRVSGT